MGSLNCLSKRRTMQGQNMECTEMPREILALSRRNTADALGISLRTVDYLLAEGVLRGQRIGRRVVIPKAEIDRLLRYGVAIPSRRSVPSLG
jgi:excisionase family DNA binding protein